MLVPKEVEHNMPNTIMINTDKIYILYVHVRFIFMPAFFKL